MSMISVHYIPRPTVDFQALQLVDDIYLGLSKTPANTWEPD